MRRRLWLLAAAGLLALAVGGWQLSKSRSYQLFGTLVWRVETAEPVVALTFDDGPPHHAPLLPLLRRLDLKATFFVTGAGLEAEPATAERMVADGHELGNHSYSHRRMLLKPPGWIAEEIESTDRLIRRAGQRGPIHFRPPYGKKLVGLPYYLAQTGRTTITWDVDPESDPVVGARSDRIVADVLAKTRPGSIILLHGAWQASAQAVEPIVTGLRARGYRFVTVSELLALRPGGP